MTNDYVNHFTKRDYDVMSHDVIYHGFIRLVRYQLRHRLFNGEWSNPFTREVAERKSAIAILPYDPVLDRVILIEQFRPGALANDPNPWLIEIVAGLYEHDQTPGDVAIRETKEEAGCEVLDLYPICEYFVSPGGSNEYLWVYCGRVDASQAGGIYGLKEENEDIRAFSLSVDEALILLKEGKIKTSPAFLSLQWLQLNRTWLKQLWQK